MTVLPVREFLRWLEDEAGGVHEVDVPSRDALGGLLDALADRDDRERGQTRAVLVRGARCSDPLRLFDELAAALQLPWYFGRNWDALNDSLGDFRGPPHTVVVISDPEVLLNEATPRDLAICFEILEGHARTPLRRGPDQFSLTIALAGSSAAIEALRARRDAAAPRLTGLSGGALTTTTPGSSA